MATWTDSESAFYDNLDTAFDAGGNVNVGLTTTTIVSQWTWSSTLLNSSTVCVKDNLDTAFDAGGNVNVGLTTTTIVSQWSWSSTLLNSSTVCIKYGMAGSMWYAGGATIQLFIFAMMSIQLRLKAPGAKTFLQVIHARFGRRTHVVYCVFGLIANIIVMSIVILGGSTALTTLVQDLNIQYASILVTAVIGIYTAIGGLGATFYVSYFSSAVLYLGAIVFLLRVYGSDSENSPIGSAETIYEAVTCLNGPEGNHDNSYFTILSTPALMFGIINIIGNFGCLFMDQSYYQSSIAAKPGAGVWGYLLSGLVFFTLPFCMSMSVGFSYLSFGIERGQQILTPGQLESGLATPVVARMLLGRTGELLITFMVLMVMTSTGSAEVIAVTSLLVYDVYQTHLRPYRRANDVNSCILCGQGRGRKANPRDKCTCVSMSACVGCRSDDTIQKQNKRTLKPDYTCKTHGNYRTYLDYLSRLKNWCLVWTTIGIFPLCMALDLLGISLGWLYMLMGVLTSSCVFPVSLALVWPRANSVGMILGAVGGAGMGIVTWLAVAGTYTGGLINFFENTGEELPMLCGNVMSIIGGLLLCVVGTYITNRHYDSSSDEEIWETTRDIDNPLTPWTESFAEELDITNAHQLNSRPTLTEMTDKYKWTKLLAYIGAILLTIVFVVVWPTSLVPIGVLTSHNFTGWVNFVLTLGFVSAVFIVVVPLVNEVLDIWKVMKNKSRSRSQVHPQNGLHRRPTLDTHTPKTTNNVRESNRCTHEDGISENETMYAHGSGTNPTQTEQNHGIRHAAKLFITSTHHQNITETPVTQTLAASLNKPDKVALQTGQDRRSNVDGSNCLKDPGVSARKSKLNTPKHDDITDDADSKDTESIF